MKRTIAIVGAITILSATVVAQEPPEPAERVPQMRSIYDWDEGRYETYSVTPPVTPGGITTIYDWQKNQYENYTVRPPASENGITSVYDWQKGRYGNYTVNPLPSVGAAQTPQPKAYNIYDWQTGRYKTVTVR